MKRVLIIEDEEVERTAIKKMLEMAGYEVEDACDGEEGIERNRQNPADAAIVDIFLSRDHCDFSYGRKRRTGHCLYLQAVWC